MKHVFAIAALMLVAVLAVYGQSAQPNGPPLGATTKGTQSLMYGGVHDFGITSAIGDVKQSDNTCAYCHRAHIVGEDGQAAPLWARASLDPNKIYGIYSSVSLDAATTIDYVNNDDNYSAFCLSCHDGSQMLATAAWGSNSHPFNRQSPPTIDPAGNYWPPTWETGSSPTTKPVATFGDAGVTTTGELLLSHTHPVNFDYNDAVAKDGQLWGKDADGYVYLDGTTTPARAVGRLFGGKMQCSSCHNPHFKTGIGLQGSSNKGALCVACHKK